MRMFVCVCVCVCVCLLAVPTYNRMPSGSEGRKQRAVRSRKTAKTRSSQKRTPSDTNSKQMGREVLGSAAIVSWGFSTNFLMQNFRSLPRKEKKRHGRGRKYIAHLKHNQSDFLARLQKRTEIIILKLKASTPRWTKTELRLLSLTVQCSASIVCPGL